MPGFSNSGGGFAPVAWRASVPADAVDFQDTTVGGKLGLLPMPQDRGGSGNGSADARPALVTLMAASPNALVPSGAYVVGSDWTLGAAESLLLLPGATLKPSASVTVSIAGKLFHHGVYNSGAGSVSTTGGGAIVDLSAAAGAAAVSSIFGRTGAVTALAADYVATKIGNDSGVAGTSTADALDALNSGKQAAATNLTALGALVSAADKLGYFTGAGTAALADLTTYARTLLDDADAAAARTTLGLGALAVLASVNNAQWSGAALALTNGGTGATSSAAARTNLEVGKGAICATITAPVAGTYVLARRIGFAYDIDAAVLKTDAGTLTAEVKIAATGGGVSTAVTGLTALAATTTESKTDATALRSVAVVGRVEITLSAVSGVGALEVTLQVTRT